MRTSLIPAFLYDSYIKSGISDVRMHLFENDRHEILNELDHGEVDRLILEWLEEQREKGDSK